MLRRLLPAALLALALLAGCGGDSGPQTKEGFINEADSVCEKLAGQFAEAGSQQPGTAPEIAKANNVLADLYEQLADGLGDVRLPDSGAPRTQAQAYVASVTGARPLLARLRTTSAGFLDAAKSNDAQALALAGNNLRSALDAFRAARANSDRLAVDYGLNFCGNLD